MYSSNVSTEGSLKPQNFNILKLNQSIPVSIDWRTKGVVNHARHQADCGSCWAFAAVSALESQYAIRYDFLPKLSEQFLVDCISPNSTLDKCLGWHEKWAWEEILSRFNGLVPTGQSYP